MECICHLHRDTTACALTNVFKYLSENPEAQTKLVDEYATATPEGQEPTLDSMKKAAYADACFNETLRLCPSVSFDGRFANEDVTLPSGMFRSIDVVH
jgi:cytochrome P450